METWHLVGPPPCVEVEEVVFVGVAVVLVVEVVVVVVVASPGVVVVGAVAAAAVRGVVLHSLLLITVPDRWKPTCKTFSTLLFSTSLRPL